MAHSSKAETMSGHRLHMSSDIVGVKYVKYDTISSSSSKISKQNITQIVRIKTIPTVRRVRKTEYSIYPALLLLACAARWEEVWVLLEERVPEAC
jgi:hypothetical protein